MNRGNLQAMLNLILGEFINKNMLSSHFEHSAVEYFIPLADKLCSHQISAKKPLFVGINGCQGSGKSTLADFLRTYLQEVYSLNTVVLSLDDFYFDKAKRIELSKNVHPLLATRGVPGTHDTKHIQAILEQISDGNTTDIRPPRFNKATDNPHPQDQWPSISPPIDMVIFEGWCWGVSSQSESQLDNPVNAFEQSNDRDRKWRQYVNQQLKEEYEPLYRYFDRWIMLKAPTFDEVYHWRLEQEDKLRTQVAPQQGNQVMSPTQIHDFIQYYQRLTEHSLTTLPDHVDHLYTLNSQRKIVSYIKKNQHD